MIMLEIYGIKNCSSMKKAFDALDANGLRYTFHDYKKQGIDAETLGVWLENIGPELLVNKKGTTWRKLSPEQQQAALSDTATLIQTLIEQPSIIKRPVLKTDSGFVVGFDADTYAALKGYTVQSKQPGDSFGC